MLKPDYEKNCITKSFETSEMLLKKHNKVVLIVVDAMGYYNLMKIGKNEKIFKNFLSKFEKRVATSVFPTTTTAGISSIYSAQTPAEHSLYEWLIYSRELNMRFYPLMFVHKDDCDEEHFKKHATKKLLAMNVPFKNFSSKKIKTFEIVPNKILDSKLDTGFQKRIGYSNIVDAFIKLKSTINNNRGKSFFYFYIPHYDGDIHDFGPYAETSREMLRAIVYLIDKELLSDKKIKVILTADHGCTAVKKEIQLETKKWFWKSVWPNLARHKRKRILPVGSARDLFLHIKPEKMNYVIGVLQKNLKKHADVYRVSDLIKTGLFGTNEPSKRFLDNIGNILILPKKNIAVSFFNKHDFVGMHGGLSKEELYVPFFISK